MRIRPAFCIVIRRACRVNINPRSRHSKEKGSFRGCKRYLTFSSRRKIFYLSSSKVGSYFNFINSRIGRNKCSSSKTSNIICSRWVRCSKRFSNCCSLTTSCLFKFFIFFFEKLRLPRRSCPAVNTRGHIVCTICGIACVVNGSSWL